MEDFCGWRGLPGCLHGKMRCSMAMPLVTSESRPAFEPGPPFPYNLIVTLMSSQVTCLWSSCNKQVAALDEPDDVVEGIGHVSISHHTRTSFEPAFVPCDGGSMLLCGSSKLFNVWNVGEVLSCFSLLRSPSGLLALTSMVSDFCNDTERINLNLRNIGPPLMCYYAA